MAGDGCQLPASRLRVVVRIVRQYLDYLLAVKSGSQLVLVAKVPATPRSRRSTLPALEPSLLVLLPYRAYQCAAVTSGYPPFPGHCTIPLRLGLSAQSSPSSVLPHQRPSQILPLTFLLTLSLYHLAHRLHPQLPTRSRRISFLSTSIHHFPAVPAMPPFQHCAV